MSTLYITPLSQSLTGTVQLPGDKSLSHRALFFSALAKGVSVIKHFTPLEDCMSTLAALQQLGVAITLDGATITVEGVALTGFCPPAGELYLGNSGTTMRLLLGILAGQPFEVTVTGDESLSRRPMKRVTLPLREMGAVITGADDANYAPLTIKGGRLKPLIYMSPVASAQVKSCLLLAGLYADGLTAITEPVLSRDHTERMLPLYGIDLKREALQVSLTGGQVPRATDIIIPGDISGAAFLMTLALLMKGSTITLSSVGLNPSRTGFLSIIERMGAQYTICGDHADDTYGEPVGDITVSASDLRGTEITPDDVVRAIDEIPVLMVAATQARGITQFKGVAELRLKETDRIYSMVTNLRAMGASIEEQGDTVTIEGPTRLKGVSVASFHDHRTAMSMIIAGLIAEGETAIDKTDCIAISFPGFIETLTALGVPGACCRSVQV